MKKVTKILTLLILPLFSGCIDFTEEIDEINEKINSLIEENSLLRQALSENTLNLSGVTASLETVKISYTKY